MTAAHVYSMTGFGTASISLPLCQLNLQLKSVNSRFLDLSFKIPEELVAHETILRDAITQRVKRGKIECKITWKNTSPTNLASNINLESLHSTLELQKLIQQNAPSAAPLSVQELLLQSGILPSSTGANTALADISSTEVSTLIQTAIDAFLNNRATEGAHLAHTLSSRLDTIAQIVSNLRHQLPELLTHQELKLTERLFKVIDTNRQEMGTIMATITREEIIDRIKQETSLTAIRIDVAEELDRLDGHISNARNTLKNRSAEGIGKKLDFLMQEFNREANTLGSKSASLIQTQASMDLKLIIEQMREQVQNIE